MLIDKSYFIGEINIPNTDKVDVDENMTVFIQKYEPLFLQRLMGVFYDTFIAGVATENTAAQRFKDILYGKSFTYYDRARVFMGLKTPPVESPSIPPLYKKSMIANYVYWYWMQDQISQTVGLGEVKANAENSVRVSPQYKMIRAWNENYKQVCLFFDFMEANKDVYPEWNTDHKEEALLHFYRVNQFGI